MKKLLHFEGLRGVAAMIVFFAHFKPTFCLRINETILTKLGISGGKTWIVADNFLKLFYDGTLPVFIFWFMSAFVISIKLFSVEGNRNNQYLIEASTKRYFRLAIPVFFSSLICFVLIKTHLFQNAVLAKYMGSGYVDGWLITWYQFNEDFLNFLKTTLVEVFTVGNCNYSPVLWTMTPELFGSLLCFGFYTIFGKTRYRFVLYMALISFFSIEGIRSESYFYYLVFICGIMWCDAIKSTDENVYLKHSIRNILESKMLPVLLLVSGLGVTIFSDSVRTLPSAVYFFFNYPVKAIGFTLLINNFDFLRNTFSTKPFSFLGKISFSFYLIHLSVLFTLGAWLFMNGGFNPEYRLLIVFLISVSVSILAAYVFTILVDRKSITASDKIGKFFANA